ncbi:hypothetical protein ACM66B_005220 [Microbotryomycetes sp. NB124-2]
MLLFLAPTTSETSPLSLLSSTKDYRGQFVWEMDVMQRQGLVSSTDDVCWDRLSEYHTSRGQLPPLIRVEQLLVSTTAPQRQNGWSGATLSRPTLHRSLKIQRELERRLLSGQIDGLECVKGSNGRCAVVSPVEWWSTEEQLLQDLDIHKTLSNPAHLHRNSSPSAFSISRVPLTSKGALAGIGTNRFGTIRDASRLVITFFLRETGRETVALLANSSRDAQAKSLWRDAVRHVVEDTPRSMSRDKLGKVIEWQGHDERVILKYLPHLFIVSNPRRLETLAFAIGYLLVAVYVAWRIRPLKVNSKSGLLLTGVVQLTTSGIMSISICWLVGWKIGLVPWNLIAFLVLVSGVDNMLVLASAVQSSDMSLPIDERMSLGLAQAGPATLVTLSAQICIAVVLHTLVGVTVFRQTIKFAAVVLVVDHLLEMTFFATILSIDTQRLELADLLSSRSLQRQDLMTPTDADDRLRPCSFIPYRQSKLMRATSAIVCAVRDRPASIGTLALLFLIDGLLYVVNGPDHFLPAFCSEAALSINRPALAPSLSSEIERNLQLGQIGAGKSSEEIPSDASKAFWSLLNPRNISSLHLVVPPPVGLQLFDDGLSAPESVALDVVSTPFWMRLATVLVPIAATIFTLWLVLLYLLKDADLLETARNALLQKQVERRQSRDESDVRVVRLRDKQSADVELITSSNDSLMSWSGLDDTIKLWRTMPIGFGYRHSVEALEIPLSRDPPSLTLLSVCATTQFAAAVTTAGRVLAWSLDRKVLIDFSSGDSSLSAPDQSKPIALFVCSISVLQGELSPPLPRHKQMNSPEMLTKQAVFITIHESGAVIKWNCSTRIFEVVSRLPALNEAASASLSPQVRTFCVRPQGAYGPLAFAPIVACTFINLGRAVVYKLVQSGQLRTWQTVLDAELTSSDDSITAVAYQEYSFAGAQIAMIAYGTTSGEIKLAKTLLRSSVERSPETPSIVHVADLDSTIRQVRIRGPLSSNLGGEKCPACDKVLPESVTIIASSRTTVSAYRIPLNETLDANECQCKIMKRRPSNQPVDVSLGVRRAPRKPRRSSQGRLGSNYSTPIKTTNHDLSHAQSDGQGTESNDTGSFGRSASPGLDGPNSDANAPSHSNSPEDVPMFDTSDPFSARVSDPVMGQPQFRIRHIFTSANDERGGWELAGNHVVGVRRRTADDETSGTKTAKGKSWVVWTIAVNKVDATPKESSLDSLLASATTVDADKTVELGKENGDIQSSSLRRRRQRQDSSKSVPSPRKNAPTVQFPTSDLPFSRIRPIVSVYNDSSVAIGLGNQIAVITPRSSATTMTIGSRHLAVPRTDFRSRSM